MGILESIIQGIKNNLRWRAQSETIRGVEKGIGAVIKRFKNKCPQCGKSIPETMGQEKFCPHCRAKLVLTCPSPMCHMVYPLGTKFCTRCGAKLEKKPKEKTEESGQEKSTETKLPKTESPETKLPESQ